MEESQDTRNEEEYAVHDAKRKASLQHCALFIRRKVQGVNRHTAESKANSVRRAFCDRGAILAADAAQFVDACDEGADEAEIDERGEACVLTGAMVGEEGCDGPGSAQDTDDEEDENVVGCQGVVAGVDVNEVCEHAEGGDLGGGELVDCVDAGRASVDELTSVTISKKRQKAKNIPKSILM